MREKSPKTWIFWLHASSAARFSSGVRDILAQLKVPGNNHSEAEVFQLFRAWLREEKERNWLLILDSADSEDVLLVSPVGEQTESQGERCIDYLPACSHGSLLVTTRTRSAAMKVVEHSDIITVEPMIKEHALALLDKKLGVEHKSGKVAQLATELDFVPLAMVQAASYIRMRESKCSVEGYIAKLQKSESSMLLLLKRQEGDLRRDREANNSIFSTWAISFEHIFTIRKSAADLLSLMSCFDRQAVPEALLKRTETEPDDHPVNMADYNQKIDNLGSRVEETDSSKSDSSSTFEREEFEDDIVTLRDYSFISITRKPSIFEMHRLVQLATQEWLKSRGFLEQWRSRCIANLDSAFPIGKFENWTECQELFPHATWALKMDLKGRDALLRQASLLENSGWYALEQGNYEIAKQMRAQSMESRKRLLGLDDPATVTSIGNIALAYQHQGQYKQALQLGEQALEIGTRIHGLEHPHTATSTSNLALTYRYLGQPDRAMKLQEQVLQIRKRILGPQHPDTVISMNNLASTYQYQKLHKPAAKLGEEALEIRESVLGSEHPDTAMSMSNLAITFQYQGQYKQAAELGERALEIRAKVLRPEHPQIATSMSNLAVTYRSQKLYDQSAELGEQALEMRKKGLPPQHPEILISMSNLASTYRCQGRYQQAAKLGEQVLEARKRALHPEHRDIATSMGNLASTYQCQGLHARAIELGRQALEIRHKVLGHEHPHTATSMSTLALSYQRQGLHKEARELQSQALCIRQRALGPEHPDTLTSRDDLAKILRGLDRD